jgi:ABC-type antimicrobial peptide transport system permease subunit
MADEPVKVITQPSTGNYGAPPSSTTRPQSLWRNVWRRFCRHRLALLGMFVLICLTLGTLVGPWLYHPQY